METFDGKKIKITRGLVDLLVFAKDIDEAESIDSLWDLFTRYAENIGADLIGYQHFAAEYTQGQKNETIHMKGFPKNWISTYIQKNYVEFDPIVLKSRIHPRPFRWLSVELDQNLTEQQKAYMVELKSWMKGDGYGIPVFGPSGQNGYFGVGSVKGIKDWPAQNPQKLHLLCEIFHLRYCELHLMGMDYDFVLTKRELLILENMAMGRSDALICGLLGVQLNSIESGVMRILKKMRVRDRSAAILRGVGCGLLDPKLVEAHI